MAHSRQREDLQEDIQTLLLTSAEVRKESAILRQDAREYRDLAHQVRNQGTTLRARAAALLKAQSEYVRRCCATFSRSRA
jgi:hypothetical protein